MTKYTIGLDFGTLSGRALLVEVETGKEIATAVMDYPHGVIDDFLPDTNIKLPQATALQHPLDYLDVAEYVIGSVIEQSKVDPKDIIGISVDFTTCTVIPVRKDGTPLCFEEKYKQEPNAYAKLWKHHAAQAYADKMTEKAIERGESWLGYFGGKISSEWIYPKIWQILEESPEIYNECHCIVEAGDWITWQLTGEYKKSYVFAAAKALYNPELGGYPSEEYFASLDERLRHVVADKTPGQMIGICDLAGRVTKEASEKYGLAEGTAVGCPHPDAHVAPIALNLHKAGEICAVLGTSGCFMLLGDTLTVVNGTCGVGKDNFLPNFYGHESGLCCFGDHFAWVVDNLAPAEYKEAAKKEGIPLIKYMINKASTKKPGETGLIALDWWNGNRNILVDSDLTGLILGMDLRTKSEDILRALIEATAFATKVIIDNFRAYGVPVTKIVACGGIARKDPFTMQLYADILDLDIGIAGSTQVPALASAIFASIAAGKDAGGYDSVEEASAKMSNVSDTVYKPSKEAHDVYMKLYDEYRRLHDYFGKGENNVMKRLLAIKAGREYENI